MRLARALPISVLLIAFTGCRSAQHYIKDGDRLLERQRYPEAVLAYRNAIQKDATSAQSFYKLGLAQRAVNDNAGALSSFLRALALNQQLTEARIEAGDIYLGNYLADSARNTGLHNRIAETAGWLLNNNPQSYAGLRLSGYLASSDRKPEEAISYFERASQIRPLQPDVVLALTENLLLTGQYDRARKLGFELIGHNKSFGPIYDVLYGYAFSTGHKDDAEILLKQKVSNNPGNRDFVVQLAGHYYQVGKPSEALQLVESLLSGPAPWDSYLLVGRFYQNVREWDRALATFGRGQKSHPDQKLRFQEASAGVLVAAGRPIEAVHILDQVLQQQPSSTEPRRTRALLLLNSPVQADRTRALQELQSMTGGSTDDAKLLFQLGRAYAMNAMPEQARQTFELALRKNSRDLATLIALADLTSRSKQFPQSLQYADRALSLNPNSPNARLLRATALVGLSRLDDARTDYSRLLRDQPDFKEAKLQLALLNVAQRRFLEAERLFRELYRPSDGDFRPLSGLVEVYVALHDWDRALAVLKTETDRSPNNVALHKLFASTAVRAGRLDLAIQQYQKVLQQQNRDVEIYTALGELFQRTEDLSTSLAMLEKARALAPNDWSTLARLASIQQQAGLLPQAKTTYRQALKLGADTPDLLNNLAYLEADAGSDLEEALTFVKKALARAPSNPQYADTLGLVYLKQKNTSSALQVFRTLSHNHPQTAIFRYHLALALFQQGDRIGGHRELQAALAADPSLTATSKIDLHGTP